MKQKQSKDKQRKPYQPPRLSSDQLHEVAAMTCGKNSPVSQDCFQEPTQS